MIWLAHYIVYDDIWKQVLRLINMADILDTTYSNAFLESTYHILIQILKFTDS